MPTCPKTQSQGPASRAWPGGGVRVRGPRGPPRLREGWSLQGQGPQSKGHIPQAVRGSPGSGYKVRLEAGSGGGHESREGPGTSFPRCPLESPASLRRHPLPRLLRCPSPTPPQPLPWPLAPPWPTPSLSPAAPSPGVRSSGGAGRPPRGPGRPLPTPGGSPAGVRPGADQPPSARLPAHGARARGPGSLGSRHLFRGAAAAAAVAAVAAVTGRGVRANEHAHRGHARGERTWRGSRGSTGAQAGSRGHPDTRPLQSPRVAPAHARGPGRRGPAAQPPGAAAVHSPWHRRARPRPPWRPCILHRTGACCRCANRHSADSQTKRQPAGPFTISQRRESLRHMSLGTLPNTPTHVHTPTRPRTHRQGRVQTRTVAGTLAFTDTR